MREVYFRNRKNGLTIEQKKYIIEHYSDEKTSRIAKKLNLSYKQIRDYASNLKITKNKKSFDNYIKEKDECGSCISKLCIVKEPKIDNLYKSKYGKYAVNDNYFEKIDNEFKAYWLGFLMADGYVNEQTPCLELTLKSEDFQHIKKFKESLQSEAEIKNKRIKSYEASRISICNKKIVEDLIKCGCVNNKSLIIEMPDYNIVPKEFYRHFIRGFFDGDGCIYLNKELKKISVSFISNEKFISQLIEFLSKELDIIKCSAERKENNKAVGCFWFGVENCYKLFKYMYEDSNIFLDRKFKKFDSIFCLN